MTDKMQPHQAETNAGFVAPSPSWFIVTRTHGHETLKVGDLVRVVEDPLCRNWIYRRDATLHELRGNDDCYVELQLAMFVIGKEGSLPQEPSTVHLPDQPCSLTSDKNHLTTTWKEPQKPPSQHPHGANYAKAVQYQNAAEQFRRIRNEILHSAYRMGQGQLLTEEDNLRLHKAASQMDPLATDMGRRADHFKNLAATPTPEPVEP